MSENRGAGKHGKALPAVDVAAVAQGTEASSRSQAFIWKKGGGLMGKGWGTWEAEAQEVDGIST